MIHKYKKIKFNQQKKYTKYYLLEIVILISLNIQYRDINVNYINYDKLNIIIRFTNNQIKGQYRVNKN